MEYESLPAGALVFRILTGDRDLVLEEGAVLVETVQSWFARTR